jgi:hypothetical protein
MRRIVQPPRCAAGMRQWNERHAILHARTAHCIFEWGLTPEPIDGEAAKEKDHPGPEKGELLIEPRSAERDLGGRRPAIAAPGRRLTGKAFRDRRPVRQMVLVDPCLGEPASQLGAGTTAERLADGHLDGARSLANDRDAIANGSGDDGSRALEISRVDALRASANACVKILEDALAVVFWLRHW